MGRVAAKPLPCTPDPKSPTSLTLNATSGHPESRTPLTEVRANVNDLHWANMARAALSHWMFQIGTRTVIYFAAAPCCSAGVKARWP
jgi:hypothetical protein